MNDVLPDEAALWLAFEDAARRVLSMYGYRNLRVPIVEPTALFVRGIGEFTDVVEKEMYTFADRLNGESLTLRPEATAGIVRAAIEHNLTYERPQRVWTTGPMFRHERPQKGRYRQFHQIDVEALGFEGPDVDAEQIVMLARLWRELGVADAVRLHVNSIGDRHDRLAHRDQLVAYFTRHESSLDEDSRRRLGTNPLRILDSKNPAMQSMIEGAPRLVDTIRDKTLDHFEGVKRLLGDAGIAYEVNPRLVRGLDYYNRTVFEWVTDRLGAQGTVAGGGRYDDLFEQLGGKRDFACGFAIGVERMILRRDSGGEGRRRGGLGLQREIRLLAPEGRLSVLSDKNVIPPYGVRGGHGGAGNRFAPAHSARLALCRRNPDAAMAGMERREGAGNCHIPAFRRRARDRQAFHRCPASGKSCVCGGSGQRARHD